MTHREYIYHRRKKFTVVTNNADKVFRFRYPCCPICDAKLNVTVNEWYRDKWGWVPYSIEIDCSTMPDMDSDEWQEWMNIHYEQPYSDWLPIEKSILYWMQREVRFSNLNNKKHHEKNSDQKKP